MVKRLSPAKAATIKAGFAEVSKELDGSTAFGNLFLAGFYEQNRLIVDAIAAYEKAIALAPEDPTYKEYYLEFLYRNKLKVDPNAPVNNK
jgi:ABC-type sugar transport system substrate-binding protein